MCAIISLILDQFTFIFIPDSKMSLSPLVTLTDICGGGVMVTEGQVTNQLVVMQGDKVVYMEGNCIEKTWYGCRGRKIKSTVSALGMFGRVKVIMVVDRRTIVWGDKENKVENCDKLELDKDIRELVVLDKQHWVVFDGGSVEQLEYIMNNDREEWVIYPPVVNGEVILQTRLKTKFINNVYVLCVCRIYYYKNFCNRAQSTIFKTFFRKCPGGKALYLQRGCGKRRRRQSGLVTTLD